MKAVIMAGGKGTRLRPLTCGIPKPMVPVANRPMMEHIINLLKLHNFEEMISTLCYMPQSIRDYFGSGREFGCNMRYSVEETPLGTAGSVKNVGKFTDETFLVISGDALTDIDLTKAIKFHKSKGSFATLVLKRVENPLEYGVVITDENGKITKFLEKPNWGEVFSDTVNTGIYILEPEVMDLIKPNVEFDFSKNLFTMMLKQGMPLYGYIADGYWCDVGSFEQYKETHLDILSGKVKVQIAGKQISENIWIGDKCKIEKGSRIIGPAILGDEVQLLSRAVLGENNVIGSRCIISEETEIYRSVIWNNCYIGKSVNMVNSVICGRNSLKSHSSIFDNVAIGEGCSVGEGSILKSGVKIWPDKVIEPGTQVNASLIWANQCNKRLFGAVGISGITNVEMTPEFVAGLGAAFGGCVKDKNPVAVGSDNSTSSLIFKDSIMSGLMSSGVDVMDIGVSTMPIMRFSASHMRLSGAVYISSLSQEPYVTRIELLDSSGINIDKATERKIENSYFTEDFKRANYDAMGSKSQTPFMKDRYQKEILGRFEASKFLNASILISSCNKVITDIIDEVALELGINVEKVDCRNELNIHEIMSMVIKKGCDFGAVIDSRGEKLTLIDETGRITTESEFNMLTNYLELKFKGNKQVFAPVNSSLALDKLAKSFGAEVIRTKSSARDHMQMIAESEEKDALAIFDAINVIFFVATALKKDGAQLSQLLKELPVNTVMEKTVDCPWNFKGTVMRNMIENFSDREIETLDGIKVHREDGWILILPDVERPVFHIYSEAEDMEIANEIASDCIQMIEQIKKE